MSAPASPVPAALEAQSNTPRISAFARLFVSFTSPGAVFEDVVRKPTVLFVLIGLTLSALLAQAVLIPKLDTESMMRKQFAKSNMPEEQQDKMIAFTSKLKWIGPVITPIAFPIKFAVLAGFYFLSLKLLGSEQNDFVRLFSAAAHANWPPGIVQALLVTVVSLTKSTIDPMQAAHIVKSNVGAFLPEGTWQPLIAFCDHLDVFEIWKVAMVTIALKVIGRVSWGKAAGVAIFFWAAATILAVAGALVQSLASGMH